MRTLQVIAFFLILTACSNSSSTTVDNQLQDQDSTTLKVETPLNKLPSTNSELPENYKAPHVSIDSFYPQKQLVRLLENWNNAINQQDLSTLSNLYAPEVTYYTKKLSKEKLLTKKEKHFTKSPNYQQEVEIIDIEYPKEKAGVIRCSFLKSFDKNGIQDTVFALIEFDSKQEPLVIIKESDQISEWQKAKKAIAKMELPRGEHSFSYDYWQDNRANNVTAWDFINCYHSLSIDNSTEEIEISFSTNYGPGSFYQYLITNVQIVDGIISFEGTGMDVSGYDDWMGRIEDGDEIPADWLQQYRFKILDFHTVVKLDEGSATYYQRDSYTRPDGDL